VRAENRSNFFNRSHKKRSAGKAAIASIGFSRDESQP
jgi:hypothetical protein